MIIIAKIKREDDVYQVLDLAPNFKLQEVTWDNLCEEKIKVFDGKIKDFYVRAMLFPPNRNIITTEWSANPLPSDTQERLDSDDSTQVCVESGSFYIEVDQWLKPLVVKIP